ncbi:MAG: SH3 domain-containing protein [Spirochaetes bacterium]|nr:SH3 domain-containing protein [Spirochaetota bacterium]
MKKIFLLLFACLIYTGLTALAEAQSFKNDSTVYVFSVSGINLREEPSTTSKVLELVPYGTKLTVLETINKPQEVDNFKGSFAKVTYRGKTGYLFDGFLSSLPAPDLKKQGNLDSYAAKYLGKGKKKSGTVTAYPDNIVHEIIQAEGYYGHKLSVPGIRLSEGFLLLRAIASSMNTGFTGKEAFPAKNATCDEKYKGKKFQVEVKINKNGSAASYEITKTHPDGHLFMISVEQSGGKVIMTAGSAD